MRLLSILLLLCYCVFINPYSVFISLLLRSLLLLFLLLCYCVFPSSPAKPFVTILVTLLLCLSLFACEAFVTIFCYYVTVSLKPILCLLLFACEVLSILLLLFLLLCYCVSPPLLCLLPFGEAGRGFTLRSLCYLCKDIMPGSSV